MHTIARNDDSVTAIAERKNWRNRSGSMSGRTYPAPVDVTDVSVTCETDPDRGNTIPAIRFWDSSGMYVVPIGSLPRAYALQLASALRRGPVYVVRSYATPIVWWDSVGTVYAPPVRYSNTTTQHQWTVIPRGEWHARASVFTSARIGKGRSPYGPRGERISTIVTTGEPVYRVVFRKYPNGDIIALFPDIPWNRHGNSITSYMHVGQHGGAHGNAVMSSTVPATAEEFTPLLRELEEIGYVVKAYNPTSDVLTSNVY